MPQDGPAYRFVTCWRVRATPDEVAAILEDPLSLPRWWPAVYLSAEEVAPGDAHGLGRIVNLRTKGWLPYTLQWSLRVTEATPPSTFALDAYGDMEGSGRCTLVAEGDDCAVTFVWEARAEKSLLRRFDFALRPVSAANHRWAMQRGEESLRLELLRRRAPDAGSIAAVPAPPKPTPESSLPLLLGAVGTLGTVAGAAVLLLRRRRPPA